MDKTQIRKLALANGFKLKPQPGGTQDLNPYVYDFALVVAAGSLDAEADLILAASTDRSVNWSANARKLSAEIGIMMKSRAALLRAKVGGSYD